MDGVNDDELNKMIANLQGGQQPGPGAPTPAAGPVPAAPAPNPGGAPVPAPVAAQPIAPPPVAPVSQPPVPAPPIMPEAESGLDTIKRDALNELRPLVDKLNLPPEDKFDTLLLMIRSTDDSSLVPAAHAAARQIADETRRAQALLDVIKEIDFFGRQGK